MYLLPLFFIIYFNIALDSLFFKMAAQLNIPNVLAFILLIKSKCTKVNGSKKGDRFFFENIKVDHILPPSKFTKGYMIVTQVYFNILI